MIEHDDFSFHLCINSDQGKKEQRFQIGAEPIVVPDTNVMAYLTWERNGTALVVNSTDCLSRDEVSVSRQLTDGGNTLVQHYRATKGSTGEVAEALSIFRRMVLVPKPSA
ncbi:unnamed protein product [Discosporangium mesarthrocarpum]